MRRAPLSLTLSSESNGVTIAVTIVPSRGFEIWGAIRAIIPSG